MTVVLTSCLSKLLLGAIWLAPAYLVAQQPDSELFRTLATLDAALFESYNNCDLVKNRTFFSDDLEFYHDQGGLTVGADTLIQQLKQNICGKTRRELVAGSMEVYPLKGYGAVQIGVHRFYNPPDSSQPAGIAKFVHIWRHQDGVWKITRVISFDHAPVKK